MRGDREAVILAGGFGTRLAHVVPDVPKPMAPVAGQPFMRFLMDQLWGAGFSRVVVADGHMREAIEGYFGACYRGMEVAYSPEDTPLLTGGAVKRALGLCSREWVCVLNGDTFLDLDFDALYGAVAGLPESARAVVSLKEMERFERYGTVEVAADGTVAAFAEKRPCERGLINAGVYLIRRGALSDCPGVFALEGWLGQVAGDGSVRSVACGGEFIDIGVPEDYARAQDMLAGRVERWKLALFDRDGTINVDTHHLFEPEKLELLPEGVDLLRRYSSDPAYKVAVVTNQAGIAKGLYTVEDMRRLHAALDGMLAAEGCRVDAYYFCPHHPDFTGPCGCRKPAPGMLLKAMSDFNAEPEDCIMFGDKKSDWDAATSAGIYCSLVDQEAAN